MLVSLLKMMINVPCRTDKCMLSFSPTTIRDLNMLEKDIKESVSLTIFKKKLLYKIRPKRKEYFGISNKNGTRYITLLRMGLSPLRGHKYNHNFQDTTNPFCLTCGVTENTEHFLLHYNSFQIIRTTLMQNISDLIRLNILNFPNRKKIEILLYGDNTVNDDVNRKVFEEVITYISTSQRLDI